MSNPEEVKLFYYATALLFLLLLIFIISFIILFRRRQNELLLKSQLEEETFKNELLSKEIENQQNLIKERERISEDIHDDIGGILSAIRLQAEFVKKKTKENEVMGLLDSISENTLIATNNFREMIWCLHSKNDSISEFNSYVIYYVKHFFEHTSIQVKITPAMIIDDEELSSFKRRQMLLAIKEISNNILKHSQAHLVKMSIFIENKHLIIHLIDDGIGFSNEPKKGIGIQSITKRIGSLEGKTDIHTSEKGTEIKMTIPL